MPYLVLARKFRPQLFEELVGQEHVTQTLTNALKSQRLAHAYQAHGITAHVAAFCHEMEKAYSAADFVLARSGAASSARGRKARMPAAALANLFHGHTARQSSQP